MKEKSYEETVEIYKKSAVYNLVISGVFAIIWGLTFSYDIGGMILFLSLITFSLVDITKLLIRILYDNKK